MVETNFVYTDSQGDFTLIGADFSVNYANELVLSKGFSGFISDFSLWYGLITVPYVIENLASST